MWTDNLSHLGLRKGVEIARRLTYGRLDLFDIQPEMLEKVRRQLERAGFRDVGFAIGEASEGFPFPDNTFDVCLLAAVIGEVPEQQACIRFTWPRIETGRPACLP